MAAQAGPGAFERLLSPIEIGRRQVRNRICFPAVVSNFAVGNLITDKTLNFYGARAEGGAGMVITEALVVHPTSIAQPSVITIFDDRNDDGLRRLAERVENADCRLIGQLWHVGRQQLWNPVSSPVGVSDQPDAFSWTVPHVMTDAEIRDVIDGFVGSAKRLAQTGFSGAELHGAHGYLIGQFLSPWSNTRADGWGGSVEARTRFAREIVDGIRAVCPSDFIVGLKMPGNEGVEGGIDPDEAARITRHLEAHGGLDYIAYSQGNFSLSLEDHVPDMHYAPGPFLDIHKRLKKEAAGRLPVMAVGRITDAAAAERALSEGAGDLIGLGRALVADASLPNKLAEGRAEAVRPCTFCNGCWGEIHAGKPIACIHNPWMADAREAVPPVARTAKAKRLVVVGGGVAGLEAAAAAAERGHDVTLMTRGDALGGAARLEAALPGRAETGLVYADQRRRAEAAGVRIALGATASGDTVAALQPDHVILATGANQRPPALSVRDHGTDVRTYLAAGDPGPQPGTAVLFDQDHTAATYAAADLLAARFDKLVLATPRVVLARSVPYVSVIGIYRRLYNAGVRIELAVVPASAPQGQVVLRNAFTGAEETIDDVTCFVWSTPRLANDSLAIDLEARGLSVSIIGDARAPRGMLAAIHEGHAAAAAL